MKPDWDKLAESAPSSVFIADINCTNEDSLCSKVGVQGYPTIKVYKDGKMEDYKGGRSFDELLEFVNTELAVQCDVSDLENSGCSEKAIQYAIKWQGKKSDDSALVTKELSRLSGMLEQSMTSDLKAWLRERISILKQLVPSETM
jgi:thioredoxin-like negative regulator of GroEL